MYIYNVTIQLAHTIHDEWLHWMKTQHIPDVMATQCFTHYQFVRLLEVNEEDAVTYAVQYYAATKADYNRYLELYATKLRADATRLWGQNFIGFRSLMQVVN